MSADRKCEESPADRLEDLAVEFAETLGRAKAIVERELTGSVRERARRGWIAQIEMALSHDHTWLGRASTPLTETIDELRASVDSQEDSR
ncbi:MAG: hypothetical protein JNJ88_03720 [Planctomycetes bacterium]|nr:hypothetical protein [Planctomycetota bacterium]